MLAGLERIVILAVIITLLSCQPPKKPPLPKPKLIPKLKPKPAPPAPQIIITTQDLIRYINQIRTYPSILIPILQDRIKSKRVNATHYQQAIRYVKTLKRHPTYNYSVVLQKAALDHNEDLIKRNSVSHVGKDGSSLYERIEKYTDWNKGTVSEAIVYQFHMPNRNNPLEILLSVIVNEANASKVYRKAFFNEEYRYCGVSVRMKGNTGIAVFLFSTELFELEDPDDLQRQQKLARKNKSKLVVPKPHLKGGKAPPSPKQKGVISATVNGSKVTKTFEDGSKQTVNK